MCEKHLITCVVCNKEFKPVKGKANKYCTVECYRAFQRSGNYRSRESKRVFNCTQCGIEFRNRERSRKRNGEECENIFCSRSCYDKHQKKIAAKECKHCKKEFTPLSDKTLFCSMDCRVEHHKPKPKNCINCDSLFSAIKPRNDSSKWYVRSNDIKTCSKECLNEFYRTDKARKEKISKAFRKEKHPNWQGGSHRGDKRGAGWNRIAEKCRELHNRTCKHCGMTEQESLDKNWGRLQVNHIVPFHQWQRKEQANKQSNLEALCKSCHTKADWKWRKENHVQMSLNIFR